MTDTLLVKTYYLQELAPLSKSYKLGDTGPEVKRIKEWLMLWQFDDFLVDFALTLDEHFDANCATLVKETQNFWGDKATGVVDPTVWKKLVMPLREATNLEIYNSLQTPAQRQAYFASRHVQYHAAELLQNNQGPWVRAYVDGNEGSWAAWCQAFTCMIWDQTFSSYGKCFDKVFPNTWSCQTALEKAKASGYLRTHQDVRTGKYQPKPGDAALYTFGSAKVAHHIETVYEVLDADSGKMRTIGGNTNFGGSHEGVGVFLVNRNYKSAPNYTIDFISMISLEEMHNV